MDITNSIIRQNGINQENNIIQDVHVLNGSFFAGVMAVGTHDIIVVPKNRALFGLKVIALDNATSSGAATLQFKLKVGTETAENINATAISKANLAKGKVHNLPLQGVNAYSTEENSVIQIAIATSDFTALNLMVIVETLPVGEFLTNG